MLRVIFCLISAYRGLFSVYIVLLLFGPFVCSFPEIYYIAIYLGIDLEGTMDDDDVLLFSLYFFF